MKSNNSRKGKNFLILLTLLPLITPVKAEEIVLDDFNGFSQGLSPKWRERTFAGQTIYRPARQDHRPCLEATSRDSASGLYYEIEFDPHKYPLLSWSWKIDHILKSGDARRKEGDDYAARVYVVFPSWLFWKTRAINYIWENHLPKGTAIPNAHTANVMMIAVESGNGLTGQWQSEERNILEDYRRVFGEEPGKVGAIAIMTDTDNTGESTSACYGPIAIRSP